METKILVADDEEQIRDMLSLFLQKLEYSVDTAANATEAVSLLKRNPYDIVLTDKNMPDAEGNIESGMELLKYIKEQLPGTEAIMITGYPTVETAVEAMKMGAIDYIMKPIPLDEVKAKIERIMEYKGFINSKNTLALYRSLQSQVLDLLGGREDLPEEKLQQNLRSLGTRIDQVFGLQKEYEKIIQAQAEALEKIQGYVEHLNEAVPKESPYFTLVEKIFEESKKRIH